MNNPHLFVFLRTHPTMQTDTVLVVANFDVQTAVSGSGDLRDRGLFRYGQIKDLVTGESPALLNTRVVIPPLRFYWLTDQRPGAVL